MHITVKECTSDKDEPLLPNGAHQWQGWALACSKIKRLNLQTNSLVRKSKQWQTMLTKVVKGDIKVVSDSYELNQYNH